MAEICKEKIFKELKFEFDNIAITGIDFKNLKFSFRSDLDDIELKRSIAMLGVLEPIVIFENEDKSKIIISGYKRFFAAKKNHLTKIPSLIIKNKLILQELFLLSVAYNENTIKNDFEKSLILNAAIKEYGFSLDRLKLNIVPFLSIPHSDKIIHEFINVVNLIEPLKKRLEKNEINFKIARTLINYDHSSQQIINENVFEKIKASTSEYKIILNLIDDYIRAYDIGYADFFKKDIVQGILLSEKILSKNKSQSFIKLLNQLNMPIFSQMKKKFDKISSELAFTKNITLNESDSFESSDNILKIKFDSKDSLLRSISEISKKSDIIEKLFKIDDGLNLC